MIHEMTEDLQSRRTEWNRVEQRPECTCFAVSAMSKTKQDCFPSGAPLKAPGLRGSLGGEEPSWMSWPLASMRHNCDRFPFSFGASITRLSTTSKTRFLSKSSELPSRRR